MSNGIRKAHLIGALVTRKFSFPLILDLHNRGLYIINKQLGVSSRKHGSFLTLKVVQGSVQVKIDALSLLKGTNARPFPSW